MIDLTEREREVLHALADDGARRALYGLWGWSRPMDVGGHSRSHHSATLERLMRRGLVERRQRSLLTDTARGAWCYRVTPAGRDQVLADKEPAEVIVQQKVPSDG